MARSLRKFAAAALFTFCMVVLARAEGPNLVANPYYKFWAPFKPGDKAVHLEQTKLLGLDGKPAQSGVDEKRIAYKLIKVDGDRVVVEVVVTEKDFLGFVQAAPTQQIYPSKLDKADLERILQSVTEQATPEVVKVDGKELKTKVVTGTVKSGEAEQIDFKLWLSDEVPGTVVKQVRTARHKGEVVAETSILLKSYKKGE